MENVGSIFLNYNINVSGRTKYINVHHHFVKDFVGYIIVNITFLLLEEILAGVFTKFHMLNDGSYTDYNKVHENGI